MKKLHRWFCAVLLVVLQSTVLQTASAEGYLYLFKKSFPGDFAAVEAMQEEQIEGNLKLTTADGKVTVWQPDMLAAKFSLFDEAKEVPEPVSLQASIEALEKFAEEEPGAKMYLQGLINQRKEYMGRIQAKEAESVQTANEALGRYMADPYNAERKYSLDYLESKLKRGEQFKQLIPAESPKITDYLKPWEEELKNRKAGLQRFEGKWLSAAAIQKKATERLESERKNFLGKELSFQVPAEAVSQNIVYIGAGVLAVSIVICLALVFNGLINLGNLGLSSVLALVFGFGGLALYSYGTWLLFQKPPGYTRVDTGRSTQDLPKSQDNIAVDELIFLIHHAATTPKAEIPNRYLLQEPQVDTFLKTYVKIDTTGKTDAFAITRKGMKVRVLVDRILIFDELSWFKKDVVVRYSFFFADSKDGFSFFKTEASAGDIPLPGKAFKYLWEQVEPIVAEILTKSKVLENYHVSRMETGMIELISNRGPAKQAKALGSAPAS